jgi:AcrR family transcriptional regulator
MFANGCADENLCYQGVSGGSPDMPRRSAEEAAKTRQRIIDAGEQLFAEQGFAAISTTAIATKAGVTDGALFHHFGSKSELFTVIAQKLLVDIHKTIHKAGLAASSPLDGFLIGARKTLEVALASPYRRIVFIEGPAILGVEKWQEIDREMGLRLIEGGLLACAETDALPAHILQPMVVLAMGTINEVIYAMIRAQKGVDPEQCFALLMRALQLWLDIDVKTWKVKNS